MDLVATEGKLDSMAWVMPAILLDNDLAKILMEEVDKNTDVDSFAYWIDFSDDETSSGNTIRLAMENILVNRGLSEEAAIQFTQTLDSISWLQIYIHKYGDWNLGTSIKASFTPLTVDDTSIEIFIFYNTEGVKQEITEKNDWEPSVPIIFAGINESGYINEQMGGGKKGGNSKSGGGQVLSSTGIHCSKVYTRKPRTLECWLFGKAEMVVREVNSNCGNFFVHANTSNKKNCDIKRSGRFSAWNGWGQGDVQLTETETSVTIEVFEADIVFDDYVIDAGTVIYPGWSIYDINPGEHYNCGSYTRCSYDFSWGSGATYIYICM